MVCSLIVSGQSFQWRVTLPKFCDQFVEQIGIVTTYKLRDLKQVKLSGHQSPFW